MRTLIGAAALSLATIIAVAPALADTKAGVDAWNRGDYITAVTEWRRAAIAGDADAQFNLAMAYKLGRGVPVDLVMAESWYRKAAMQGHPEAIENYGLALFQEGKKGEAVPWLEKAVAAGSPRAQLVLGTMLFNGDGIERDWVRAYALMVRASAAGLSQGSQTLAEMDRYIPADQRQQGLTLARQYEQQQGKPGFGPDLAGGNPDGPALAAANPPPSAGPGAPYAKPGKKPKPDRNNRPPVLAANPPESDYPGPSANPGPAYTPGTSYSQPQYGSDSQSGSVVVPAPPPRPGKGRPTVVAAPPAPPAPAPAAGGSWRVQFGAFRDEGNAKNLWTRLKGQVAGLAGMQPYLRRAGGITKLQAGPIRSEGEAAKLCVAVKRAGSECVPVNP